MHSIDHLLMLHYFFGKHLQTKLFIKFASLSQRLHRNAKMINAMHTITHLPNYPLTQFPGHPIHRSPDLPISRSPDHPISQILSLSLPPASRDRGGVRRYPSPAWPVRPPAYVRLGAAAAGSRGAFPPAAPASC